MTYELYVLVRQLPNGNVVAASVDLPAITAEHATEAGALTALAYELRQALRKSSAVWRAWLGQTGEPELLPVPVEIPIGRKRLAKITVETIVVRRSTNSGDLFIARVVGLPYFQVAVDDRALLEERLAKALVDELEDWPVDSALSFDAIGTSRFATVSIMQRPVAQDAGMDEVEGSVLEELGQDLVERAESGLLAGLDRRDELVERVLAVLASEGRSSVLLVGARDVGKTTLVY